MRRYTFSKPEHLCLQNDIERLFSAGSSSMSAFPLRATYRTLPYSGRGPRVMVLLSVAKRRLHHATERNRAKRQLREAYRLQKHKLLATLPDGLMLHIAFIWLSPHPARSAAVHSCMGKLLRRIGENLQAHS